MAKEIGVRELKNQASQLVRAVREEMAEYVITVRGEANGCCGRLLTLSPDDYALPVVGE